MAKKNVSRDAIGTAQSLAFLLLISDAIAGEAFTNGYRKIAKNGNIDIVAVRSKVGPE